MPAFLCPSCGHQLKAKQDLAGRKVRCPKCRLVAEVPRAEDPGRKAGLSEGGFQAETAALRKARPANAGAEGCATSAAARSATTEGEAALVSMLAPPRKPDELGRLGDYRVLKLLGRGGMGVVFHAEDEVLRRAVALKVIRPEHLHDEARRRFLREARALAAVAHDNVVSIFQVGAEGDVLFLAMPLLEGCTLADHLEAHGALETEEAARIAREMALGLQAAHARGLIHRDVKPSNVWLEGERRRVKLLDFGLAHEVGGADGRLTHTGVIMGTPTYMSPEQARGQKLDHRADLYSLGCVLYEMCTNMPPFLCPDTAGLLAAILTQEARPVRKLAPRVPPRLADLIHRLMAKDPDSRPRSAEEVAAQLQYLASPDSNTSPSISGKSTGQGRRPARNRTRKQGRGVVLGVILAGGILLSGLLVTGAYYLGRGGTHGQPLTPPEQQPGTGPSGSLLPEDPLGLEKWQNDLGKKGPPPRPPFGPGKKGPPPEPPFGERDHKGPPPGPGHPFP